MRGSLSKVCITELRVRYAETDQMGVVYHTHYLVWCEVARTDFIRMLGIPYIQLEQEGTMLAVAEATARYHGAARYDDRITVETTLTDVRSRAITFDYLIRNDAGERLCSARTVLVSLDRNGRPRPMAPDLRDRLNAALTRPA